MDEQIDIQDDEISTPYSYDGVAYLGAMLGSITVVIAAFVVVFS